MAPMIGNNFFQWSCAIKRALGARSKLELLDRTLPESRSTCRYYKRWLKTDYMIANWITNLISKELVSTFSHLDTTKKLWDALNKRFGRYNGLKVYRLQRKIFGYRQGEQNVLTYFNNLTALWNGLDMLLPTLNCVCEAERCIMKE